MQPITNLPASLGLTFALLFGLGYLASTVPVTMAEQMAGSAPGSLPSAVTEPAMTEIGIPDNESDAGGLRLEISRIRNAQGTVIVLVFDAADAFATYDFTRAVGYAELAAAPTLSVEFPHLQAGPYAIAFFHDENGNDDLDMQGPYPLEGYGTTGAGGPLDEPDFAEASVNAGRVSARMYYLQ